MNSAILFFFLCTAPAEGRMLQCEGKEITAENCANARLLANAQTVAPRWGYVVTCQPNIPEIVNDQPTNARPRSRR